VLEFDVSDPAQLPTVQAELAERWDRIDGALHAIGFAPAVCLGGTFMDATWDDVGVAVNISAYSYKALADAVLPLMTEGGSLVGLDFDATVSYPAYDWMGVAKAAFESTSPVPSPATSARGACGVNLVAAGPVKTIAAKSIPGFKDFEDACGPASPARLGCQRLVGRRQGLRGAAVGLVPADDGRDHPRGRRLPTPPAA